MKHQNLLYLISIIFILFPFSISAQTIRYVTPGAGGAGLSWNDASGDLQLMINASSPGDQIWVAGGVYKPVHRADNMSDADPNDRYNAFVLKKDVKVFGGFAGDELLLANRNLSLAQNSSTLSGNIGDLDDDLDNCYHVVISVGDIGSTELNGFTVSDGNSNGSSRITVNGQEVFDNICGGIRVIQSSPLLTNLTISKNSGTLGGGLVISMNSKPVINKVSFVQNNSGDRGGAVINEDSDSFFSFVTFYRNNSENGGAIYNLNSSPVIDSAIFESNHCHYFGAGIFNVSSSPVITRALFIANRCESRGGAIYNNGGNVKMNNIIFSGNECAISGGAVLNLEGEMSITNAVFDKNRSIGFQQGGGGIWNSNGKLTVINSTFSANQNAIYVNNDSVPILKNVVFWGNTDFDVVGNINISYSYTQQDLAGAHNIHGSQDPFIDINNPAGADGKWGTNDDGLRLTAGSSARNSGDNDAINETGVTKDISVNNRIRNGIVDMGAYEAPVVIPDANGILYVDKSNSGMIDATGNSWENAIGSMQEALTMAIGNSAVHQVWVAKGIYQPAEGASFSMIEGVKIFGGFEGNETELSQRKIGNGNYSTLKGNSALVVDNSRNSLTDKALLDGFIITEGIGGMLNNNSSPTLHNLIFINNTANEGAGMDIRSSSPHLANILFYKNKATTEYGGGIRIDNYSSPIITNVTVVANEAPAGSGGGIFKDYQSGAQITNAVFFGNTARFSSPDFYYDGSNGAMLTYSYLQSELNATGNIHGLTDPFLNSTDPVGPDNVWGTADDGLQLKTGSPAIDAGYNDGFYGTGLTTDIAGKTRMQHIIIDMGAYESAPSFATDNNGILYVKKGASGNGESWQNAVGELADALKGADELNKITAGDVKQIWVAGGTYNPLYNVTTSSSDDRDKSFMLLKDVNIFGGFQGNESSLAQRDLMLQQNASILDGDIDYPGVNTDNTYHVVLSVGDIGSASLNGFTIRNGNGNGAGSVQINGNDIFRFGGGGICNVNSSPGLTNLVITDNSASYGAGVYNLYSSAILTNTLLYNNIANFQGGGIYNRSSSPVLTNAVISKNNAGTGSAMYNNLSNPSIRNSVISSNLNSGITSENGSAPVITYSLVQGLPQDQTNHNFDGSTDPLFTGISTNNFHLKEGSVLIGSGNKNYFNSGQVPDLSSIKTDLEGNPRFSAIQIDLGVYQTQTPLAVTLIQLSAQLKKDMVNLQWTTKMESNNQTFIVSRSGDGRNFDYLGSIAGAGNSILQNTYVFHDTHPLPGINVYRLQQKDIDGRLTTVGICKIEWSQNSQVKIFPSPVRDLLHISFGSKNPYYSLDIIDNAGKTIKSLTIDNHETYMILNLEKEPPGIYYIRLKGRNSEVRKIVKE